MATVYSEIKQIYDKHFNDEKNLVWEGKSDFKSLKSDSPDIAELAALEELVESRGETNPYLLTLYKKFALNEADGDEGGDDISAFDELQSDASELEKEDSGETEKPDGSSAGEGENAEEDDSLGKNEETFANKYPDVDEKEVLKKSYVTWLDAMVNKPFFKTIANFYDLAKMNQLNFVDRSFLWNFLKAVSSCITHLLIEGAQREEAICLVDSYFDSLNDCLNTTIHAKSKDDVIQAFLYMVSFLGLNRDVHGEVENLDIQGEDSTNREERGSVGEF